ncbi:ArsR family transcriptional regulator [Novosphingobium sp. PhB165]|uniref:ArsR/SmtB family transcription factor n=1 Tax=Novosphingobium sp. PhB165 TaxID=2485105 RepID=UPI0010467DD0|nr:metalloregulator ArsR/SmtB family transcription factor [Novosphingobium sp. PhB165]TCM18713.1 ArsR family transcriptional regulator [Novosphingobium sp. PhB165]
MVPATESELDATAELLRALAHPLRLQILNAVRAAELSVGEIEDVTGIGQPGLSQQLAVLRKAELVATRRTGKQVFYRVDGGHMAALAAFLAGMARDGVSTRVLSSAPTAALVEPVSTTKGGAAGFARVLR